MTELFASRGKRKRNYKRTLGPAMVFWFLLNVEGLESLTINIFCYVDVSLAPTPCPDILITYNQPPKLEER